MSQKRLIDSLCRLGCCYYQVQQICCRQIRLEIVNCPVPQDARSCSYLSSCQHLPLGRSRIKCVNIPPNLHLPSKKKWHTCLPPPPPPPRPPRPNILMMDEDYVRMQWSCVWASPVFPCKIFVQMQAGRQTSRFGVRVSAARQSL